MKKTLADEIALGENKFHIRSSTQLYVLKVIKFILKYKLHFFIILCYNQKYI